MFEIKTTTKLDSTIYRAALQIRKAVFVKEQGVPEELELDNEQAACYYVAYQQGQPAATARIMAESNGAWHIQRVATLKEYRHQGCAKLLLEKIEEQARAQAVPYLTLGAQDQAQGFYRALGYRVVGPSFLDAGIPHHTMEKRLTAK
ncbi:GNAT family N-acetyltransferase [Liquorilactobacillus capillatus]|uniref:Acetyltransferase n=1 Tax=Liquorilactobacillus capillatus DSM 19910 TaxID=1423731 RepID=A0A0R1ME90_9LACO|nr:GNAT family N-acetyltransferase [Liquorilactobacillus capillatus]KRL01848.1 acetyltransferase [Liquorilactobacillus capillatus DSM 19910]